MRRIIDEAGRITIPKALRDRLGLRGGESVEINERDVRIEIQPVVTPMKLVESEKGISAAPDEKVAPLTDEIVRAILERTRR